MDTCPFCGDVESERRVHVETMDDLHEHFLLEYRRARQEYKRIEDLMRDVVWYNFETVARTWKHPWPESYTDSHLELHAHRYELVSTRGGRCCEKAEFPVYYEGAVRHAPPLPPEIVLHELKSAWEAVKVAEDNCAAPYEWAPGGRRYEKMVRESEGVAAYKLLSDMKTRCDGREGAFKRGSGLLLGDPMEREVTKDAETASENVLGRVCGDRCLVCPRTGSRRSRRGVGGGS